VLQRQKRGRDAKSPQAANLNSVLFTRKNRVRKLRI
jgi:hypothetical protein